MDTMTSEGYPNDRLVFVRLSLLILTLFFFKCLNAYLLCECIYKNKIHLISVKMHHSKVLRMEPKKCHSFLVFYRFSNTKKKPYMAVTSHCTCLNWNKLCKLWRYITFLNKILVINF